MIVLLTMVSLSLLLGMVSSTYAQSDDVGSVLEKAQEALKAQTDKPSTSTNKSKLTIPKNADIYLETRLTYNSMNTLWYFPRDAVINFAEANKVCPERVCIQEFQDVAIDKYPDKFPLIGTLKVEDKKGSTADIRSWKIFELRGMDIKITNVMQDTKSNQTTSIFNGVFRIDFQDESTKWGKVYKIQGMFQEPSGLFSFTGKEIQIQLLE